jgi:hypothetical protein
VPLSSPPGTSGTGAAHSAGAPPTELGGYAAIAASFTSSSATSGSQKHRVKWSRLAARLAARLSRSSGHAISSCRRSGTAVIIISTHHKARPIRNGRINEAIWRWFEGDLHPGKHLEKWRLAPKSLALLLVRGARSATARPAAGPTCRWLDRLTDYGERAGSASLGRRVAGARQSRGLTVCSFRSDAADIHTSVRYGLGHD